MPRAEPALPQVARLRLPAVVGPAIRTGITTPVTPGGPPPRTADSGRVSYPHPSGSPWESSESDLALRHAHCHDASRTHGPKGRSGGAAWAMTQHRPCVSWLGWKVRSGLLQILVVVLQA